MPSSCIRSIFPKADRCHKCQDCACCFLALQFPKLPACLQVHCMQQPRPPRPHGAASGTFPGKGLFSGIPQGLLSTAPQNIAFMLSVT